MTKPHMLTEADHMSERARAGVLRLAAARRYPVGGIAASTLGTPPDFVRGIAVLGRVP